MPPIALLESELDALFETVTVETWLEVAEAAGTAKLLFKVMEKTLAVIRFVVRFVVRLGVGDVSPVLVWEDTGD
jgi:uncharacterized protein YggT (Ycf19 family)